MVGEPGAERRVLAAMIRSRAFMARAAVSRLTCVAALAIAMCPAAISAAWARAGPEIESRDPLVPLLNRYLQAHEVDGVVLDGRWVVHEPEAVRLSIQPQLLGYVELYRWHPSDRIRQDIVDRADYLLARFDQVRGGSVFDGMLGYSFFEAFEITGDTRYFDAAQAVITELEAIGPGQLILNGGLMAAMAFAADYRRTGDAVSEQMARTAIAGLATYQHADGSFPHWCAGTRDVHYTDWMTMELILIQRRLEDPRIPPLLASMGAFLEGRVTPNGGTSYEAPCPGNPNCTIYYWSLASGCGIDVDTRAFTNELGYSVLLFDHLRSPKYHDVMRFLLSLESGGTWGDKWDFWPDENDPYYVWTAADTSVINTSLNFWALAAALPGRSGGAVAWGPDEDPSPGRRAVPLDAAPQPLARRRHDPVRDERARARRGRDLRRRGTPRAHAAFAAGGGIPRSALGRPRRSGGEVRARSLLRTAPGVRRRAVREAASGAVNPGGAARTRR